MRVTNVTGLVFCAVGLAIQVAAFAQSAEQSRRTSGKNAAVLETAKANPSPAVMPLVGQYEKVTVKRGESLFDIARRHNVALTALRRANRLKSTRIKPGRTLLLPTLHILPRKVNEGIVLNVPERALYLFREGNLVSRYPVAIGQSSWQTALGEFRIRKKLKNPPWQPTKEMVEREGISPEIVPPGPKNPLGDRWMGWTQPGFGFHSTLSPRSIGTAASHGCVRLYPEAARKLFDEISVGMPIYSVYDPLVVGKMNGRFYLSVFPDVYDTGLATLERARQKLEAAGLAGIVDPQNLRDIIAAEEGFPRRIVGADESVTVNGVPIKAAVEPTRVNGQWIVPVREVAAALGAQLTAQNGAVQITGSGHAITLRTGDTTAEINGKPSTLLVAPAVVDGVTMAPLAALAEGLGAAVAFEKGKSLAVTSKTVDANPGAAGGSAPTPGSTPPPPRRQAR